MNSQPMLKLKTSSSLYNKKNQANYRSLSLIDGSKANSVQKNFRLKTEYQQSKRDKDKRQKKTSSQLLNSSQLQRSKVQGNQRYSQSGMESKQMQLKQQNPHMATHEKKLSQQWVNSVLPTLSAETLYQQNHQLKKECNYLRQQNNKLTSKISLQKKQKQKLAKQLSLQNQYYNFSQRFSLLNNPTANHQKTRTKINNSLGFHPVNYMITGIKFRYQKLKADYEMKCKEVEEILRITQYTEIQQLMKETVVLSQENQKLLNQVIRLAPSLRRAESQHSQSENMQLFKNQQNCFRSPKFLQGKIIHQKVTNARHQQETTAHQFRLLSETHPKNITSLIQAKKQLLQSNSTLNQQNNILTSKIQTLEQQLTHKDSVIKNMHKSLTLLDNELYHKKKENSKIRKIQKQLEAKLVILQQENLKAKQQSQKEITNSRRLNEQMFERQKKIFSASIEERSEKIAKLQKQVSYLSALLKYWKPLQRDQKSSIRPQSSSKLDSQQHEQSSMFRTSLLMISNRKRTKTKISQNQKSTQDFKLNMKQPVLSLKPSECQGYDGLSSSEQQEDSIVKVPKTSRQKHSENGFKARKINPLQIQYMKEQLRYRCMARRLTMQQIKGFFNVRFENIENLEKKEQLWKQKFTTMRQLLKILVEQPFNLTKQQAYKFSRFIVEDTSAQHVFCDQQNQIERQIVKSIIKAFIGQYSLPDIEKCKMQLATILSNYGVNLRKALDALCEKGIISPQKLFGLMQSLGIEISQPLRNQVVCRLYEKSENRNLSNLKYELMFEDNLL